MKIAFGLAAALLAASLLAACQGVYVAGDAGAHSTRSTSAPR